MKFLPILFYTIKIAVILCFFFIIAVLLSGCTTTRYVTVPETHNDTVQITKHQRDSIWLHDSIHVKEYQKGDTVFVESRKWLTKYVERERRDTIYKSRVDSVGVPYPVEVKVPAELSWWQQLRLWLGNITLAVLLALCGWGAVRLWMKLH